MTARKEMMNRLNDATLVNVNGGDRKELVELYHAFGLGPCANTGWLAQMLYSRCGVGAYLYEDNRPNEYWDANTKEDLTHAQVLAMIG